MPGVCRQNVCEFKAHYTIVEKGILDVCENSANNMQLLFQTQAQIPNYFKHPATKT
jgi:hypothetical protein